MVLNVHRNRKAISDGEKGWGYGDGGRGRFLHTHTHTPLSLYCHHQNDSCIKMGNDESHFNVSVVNDGQSHKTVSTNHNLFEEKGEPKRYRTEVLPLTSPTPYYSNETSNGDNNLLYFPQKSLCIDSH